MQDPQYDLMLFFENVGCSHINHSSSNITPLGLRLWPIFTKRDIAALLIPHFLLKADEGAEVSLPQKMGDSAAHDSRLAKIASNPQL